MTDKESLIEEIDQLQESFDRVSSQNKRLAKLVNSLSADCEKFQEELDRRVKAFEEIMSVFYADLPIAAAEEAKAACRKLYYG